MRLVLRGSMDPGEQYVEIDDLDQSRNIVSVVLHARADAFPFAVVTYLCEQIEADGEYEISHRCGLDSSEITEFSFGETHGDGWSGSLLPLIVEGAPGIYGVMRLRDFDGPGETEDGA